MTEKIIQADARGIILKVKVAPRSTKNGLAGIVGEALKINLTAAPVNGAANQGLVKFLARLCNLSPGQIEILSGHTSRQKRLRLVGAELEKVKKALNLP